MLGVEPGRAARRPRRGSVVDVAEPVAAERADLDRSVGERRRRAVRAAPSSMRAGRLLGALDVGLVERVDAEHPAGDRGGDSHSSIWAPSGAGRRSTPPSRDVSSRRRRHGRRRRRRGRRPRRRRGGQRDLGGVERRRRRPAARPCPSLPVRLGDQLLGPVGEARRARSPGRRARACRAAGWCRPSAAPSRRPGLSASSVGQQVR